MPRRGKGAFARRAKWWTRDRVVDGLRRFHADFGFTPTDQLDYAKHQQFTGRDPQGNHSNLGWHQRYPSHATLSNYFPTMRSAWRAAGFEVDSGYEEWTAMEDWFVLESVGIVPRCEVAEILKRTGPAIKRRLYDLGDIRSYNRWGITLTRAETLSGIPGAVIRKYLEYGIIPYLRGNKLIYLNPADLLKVDEIDWSRAVNPELERLVRAAVAQRICKMLKFGTAWRDHEVYKFQPTKQRYAGRIKNPRKSAFAGTLPPVPNDLVVGDWIKASSRITNFRDDPDRVGVIKILHFSPQANRRLDGTTRACWIARVECPKIRTITNEKSRRIRYTVPLDCLERAEQPHPEPKPLSMNKEAVRGRRRRADPAWGVRAKERLRKEVAPQLT